MQYSGKVVGMAMALLMGGGFQDVVLGFLVGHMFDQAHSHRLSLFADRQERQSLFSFTTFEVMGHLTKPKGRVTKVDVHIANVLMDCMNLHGVSRAAAQQAFRDGETDNYPLRGKMCQLRSVCFGRFDLIRTFLEVQLQAAFADGELHPNEREVLFVITDELGISRTQFDQFLRMMQDGAQSGGGSQQQSCGQHGDNADWQQAQHGPILEDVCNVLGMKPTNDAATAKRTYHKLMNEHHPDKLVARGLPPKMTGVTKQKAQEIQKTWELIKEQHGF